MQGEAGGRAVQLRHHPRARLAAHTASPRQRLPPNSPQVIKWACPGHPDPQPRHCPGFAFPVPATVQLQGSKEGTHARFAARRAGGSGCLPAPLRLAARIIEGLWGALQRR